MDPLLELELAKVRLAQTAKEINLEQLRQKGRKHYSQVMADKTMADGEAKNTIVHCALLEPEEGNRKALELLEEAFDQKHKVAHAFIDNMLNIPAIKGTNPYNLRRLSREMHICELTLTQMNYVSDLNSTKTIECMFLKLPLHLQREWVKVACRVLKTGKEPSFKDLCEFAKEQSDIANTRYGLLVTGDPSNRNQKQSVTNTKGHLDSAYRARVSFANTNEFDVTPPVRRKTLGLSCLLFEPYSKKLSSAEIMCRRRGRWRHHTLLHKKWEEQRDNNNSAHINTQLCTEKSVECVQKQVAFAIVPVLIKNGEKSVQTCAFLDSGSEASLITEDLAKRLGLEGESETISLKTLDNQFTFQCKEVQVEISPLDSSSSIRIPNVWTVERLPVLRRTVPKASQLASCTHFKDINFPRVEDENVSLLIGCNTPSVHETKEIRTGKSDEPSAVRTLLGWTLFGSYGEPCKNNRVVNHLSAKEELEDKFEQLYSTEFKDPFSRPISMFVEDRVALSVISDSVQRLNGHYQISLTWRHKHKLPIWEDLTKWTSNSAEVLEFIPEEDRVEGNIIVCESNETSKRTLGIEWNVRTDELCSKVHEFYGNPTRRNILSYVASIFDPIGFVAPIILPAKVVSQDTCRQKLDWDAELPIDCQAKWNIWCRHIKELDHLRIPRCLKPGFEPSSAQIHCLADASELAYGVVAYIRNEGDLVLVSNVEMNRGLWPKAIVEQVSYGPKGRVRMAKLRTSKEEIVRDVPSRCLLEEAGYLTATTTLNDGRGARFGGSAKCNR
ncbi:unnamed protein product [Schistosoma curassoni]|uniref:DUF5641 domain-containing protein n=1 Tax=Schistosoma curassoni TaxID=6186 RepID=A0A183K6R2_9TREM|nr:unnamed protein product [Schistosoma curassoni]